jgi:hypothetical protein
MAADGTALAPAVLFLDGRSRDQSAAIRDLVGERRFLAETCNLPVSGGSSLSSILWFRDEQPEVWAAAAKFGHCNTYLVKRMTGHWAIDPSTVSITGLYNTARNDLTWNQTVLDLAGIPTRASCRRCMHSHEPIGRLLPAIAAELGLPGRLLGPLRGQRRGARGALGRPDRARRHQHHQRDVRHRQRLHGPADRVANLQRPLPRHPGPVAHLLRPQCRRRGARLVPPGRLQRAERGRVLRPEYVPACSTRSFGSGPGRP